jgi:hypothetical protein
MADALAAHRTLLTCGAVTGRVQELPTKVTTGEMPNARPQFPNGSAICYLPGARTARAIDAVVPADYVASKRTLMQQHTRCSFAALQRP